jgi:ankyrin repeat protein
MKSLFSLTLLVLLFSGAAEAQMPQELRDQKLVVACIKNDLEAARELLARGASARAVGLFGQPAILIAAQTHRGFYSEEKTLAIIELLLKNGADINAKNAFGTTPLMASQVYASSVEMLRQKQAKLDAYFFARGADKNVKDVFGGELIDYPYFNEVEYPSRSAKGKPLDANAVAWRLLIEGQMMLPDAPEKYERDPDGVTLVMAAAYYSGSLGRVNPARAIYFEVDKKGNTVPMFAAIGDCPGCLFGLDDKAFVNKQNNLGETALILATQFDHGYVVKKLLGIGADPNLKDKQGKTALFYAAEYDYFMSAMNLLAGGANPQELDADGLTPLMLAAKLGNTKAVSAYALAATAAAKAKAEARKTGRAADKFLAKTLCSINLNFKNRSGETALSIARKNGKTDIIKILNKALSNRAATKEPAKK